VLWLDQTKVSDEPRERPLVLHSRPILSTPKAIVAYFLSKAWKLPDGKHSFFFSEALKLFLDETVQYERCSYKNGVLKLWDTYGDVPRRTTMTLDEVTELLLNNTAEDVLYLAPAEQPIDDIAAWATHPDNVVNPDASDSFDYSSESESETEPEGSAAKRPRVISLSDSD
jgi:hypothetical protein